MEEQKLCPGWSIWSPQSPGAFWLPLNGTPRKKKQALSLCVPQRGRVCPSFGKTGFSVGTGIRE